MKDAGGEYAGRLTSRDEFQFIADLVFKHTTADQTSLRLHDGETGTTRFANSQVVQNVNVKRATLTVTAAFDKQHGTASTTDLSAGAVQDVLRRAERSAKASPPDPEYLPPLGPQPISAHRSWSDDSATAGPEARLDQARHMIQLCQKEGLTAAGTVSSSASTFGLAATTGLISYEPRTETAFSLTAIGGTESGWSANRHRSFNRLDIHDRTMVAIDKAKRAANPIELPPGRYTVILEPSAVAGFINRLVWELGARTYYKHTSPLTGMLGLPLVDSRLSLKNVPTHPDLLGDGFSDEGIPAGEVAWIHRGILQHLRYDRFTAQAHQVPPSPQADATILAGESVADEKIPTNDDLIQGTERGILVTNFWYIRSVNPTDLTLTGMTRDGTFLIENGRIIKPIRNFRFHDSPLFALQRLEGMTLPQQASSAESGKMLVPAMKIREFNFSSVTRF